MAMMCSTRLIRRLPARESRWRFWSPLEASSGAVPFQDANLPLSANRAMSPTSPRSRAAPEGPMPCTVSSVLPVAVTSSLSSAPAVLMRLPVSVSSVISSAASRRRVLPAMSRGRMVASSSRACAADRNFFAPPGSSSSSSRCSRLVVCERATPSSSRRSAKSRSATIASSTAMTRRPLLRSPASATECAPARVGLTALAGGEHPGPGRQLRRHIHDRLAVGDQALRDVPADPVAALHRPGAVLELAARGQHRLVAVPVSAEPAREQHLLPVVDDLDRRRALMRIHPDDHGLHVCSPRLETGGDRRGGQRYFELGRPLLSLSAPR